MVSQYWEGVAPLMEIGWAHVPTAKIVPFTFILRPSPTTRMTPGWMVRVCPEGTVRLAVAMYGLQVLLHVPETFPDTKQAPCVKRGEVASATQSAERRMNEGSGLGFSPRPGDVVFRIIFAAAILRSI